MARRLGKAGPDFLALGFTVPGWQEAMKRPTLNLQGTIAIAGKGPAATIPVEGEVFVLARAGFPADAVVSGLRAMADYVEQHLIPEWLNLMEADLAADPDGATPIDLARIRRWKAEAAGPRERGARFAPDDPDKAS